LAYKDVWIWKIGGAKCQLGLSDSQQHNVKKNCMLASIRGYALRPACLALGKEDRIMEIQRSATGSESRYNSNE